MTKRDELNRLLKDCSRGKVDRIVTKSVSRLARNTENLLCLYAENAIRHTEGVVRVILVCVCDLSMRLIYF